MKKNDGKDSNINRNLIIGIILVIVICVLLFFMVSRSNSGNNSHDDVSIINEEPATEAVTEAVPEGQTIDLSVTPVELDDSLYSDIDTLNANLQKYYDDNYSQGKLISVYGFLYNSDTMLPVDINEIEADLPEKLKDADIIYVKPADFEVCDNADELDIDLYNEDLKPFTAVYTDKGYLLSSAEYKGGLLTYDNFRSLMMRYNLAHGEISSPERGSEQFKKIYDLVSKEWGADGTVDIKYMGVDDKYGIVVGNIIENPLEFREFLIMKAGDSWAVRSKELAQKENVKQFVNEKYPDLDLSLLPYYNLSDYTDFKTDLFGYYDQIVNLSDLGVTKADLPAVYCLYSDNFIYYEFGQGKKIVGHLDGTVLSFYKVESTDEAVALMSSFTDKPPVFIIKFS